MQALLETDRSLPNSPELERSVLGAVLVDPSHVEVLFDSLSPGDFFLPAHQRIFSAMRKLVAEGRTPEEIALFQALAEDEQIKAAGGIAYIAALADGVHRKAPIAQWAAQVRELSLLRSLAHAGEGIKQDALSLRATVEGVAQRAQGMIASLAAAWPNRGLGRLASEIEPEHVSWLWPGRIPLGKLTVLDGDPGLGKSALTLDLAARVTRGRRMPDGTEGAGGGVLVLSAEDGAADTIVPRLIAAEAYLPLVRILETVPCADGERQPEIPTDLGLIDRVARQICAKLIILDPIMAFLAGSANAHRDQDVRRVLAPLAAMAQSTGAAVLVIRHLNKALGDNPLYRGGGSIAFIGAARSGLLAAPDPDDESGSARILASTKCNLGPRPESLQYAIRPAGDSIRLEWFGTSEHRASALLATPGIGEERSAVQEAADFLRSYLSGRAAPAEEVRREAHKAGISDRTLERAKKVARVRAVRRGFEAGSSWVWEIHELATNGS